LGNSYGAGNYAMCGKAYDPRLIFAWPSAQIAVMGGKQAANTLLQIQVAASKKKGEPLSEEDTQALLSSIQERYDEQTSPYYAASRLWVDGIINPLDTRKIISTGIEMADHQGELPTFNPGVIQT
ncbi:MAG: carboxyl transferase domain-containing protein, partial [Bacteroidota bacterium]